MRTRDVINSIEGMFTDVRRQHESDLIEQLAEFLCGHIRGKDARQYVAEILDELARRAYGRELGEDLEADYVFDH